MNSPSTLLPSTVPAKTSLPGQCNDATLLQIGRMYSPINENNVPSLEQTQLATKQSQLVYIAIKQWLCCYKKVIYIVTRAPISAEIVISNIT